MADDAIGHMLSTPQPSFEIIERDDGFVNIGAGHAGFFAPYDQWRPAEKEAMPYVKGRVLDIGCGGGRHSLYLQEQGYEVTAIDISPLATEVCRQRGVKDARVVPLTQLNRSLGQFDTLLMLGGNFGYVGNLKRAHWLLRRFYHMTSTDGRILASSLNPYNAMNAAHLNYHERNRQRGRIPGQVRVRYRFQQYIGEWRDLLLVSPDEMHMILDGTGWHITKLLGDPNGGYIAIVEKI